MRESFPRLQPVRTPLKLLAPDEVPMDTSVATSITTATTDMNNSRQMSLQPVWYTEQTIVDDHIEQQRLDLTRSTLPPIESDSPDIEIDRMETEALPRQPSLMRKSSTFTIDQQPSINIPSSLNESEKENDLHHIMTSTQEEPKHHPQEPSDESFRQLEHLLGLGSTNINLTMTTTAQESPKSNHESLSLTIVTPTELINQTGNSLHLSYAPAGGSLPSSQNILLMPTIESITEPSINSTLPPPFAVDNSDTEEPSSAAGTIIHPDSLHFTDDEDDQGEETPKDDTNDFSFELNDFTNNSNDESTPPAPPPPPPPPMITVRAPTSADVAYRALIKPRTAGRISQPVKNPSPLVKTLPARSSVPNLTSQILRRSARRVSANASTSEAESFDNETKTDEHCPPIELVEVVSLSEDEEMECNQNAGITLNLTESKEIQSTSPTSAEEADRSASSSCSSYVSIPQEAATPTNARKPVLSREFTYNTPTSRSTRSSERRRSIFINPPRATQSLIPTIPEQLPSPPPNTTEEENVSIYSVPSSSNSMLSPLSTNPTTISEAPPIILQKSLAGSASPSPNPTPTITIRPNDRLSSNLSPRRSIHPLHSSTPSIRNKSLQIVSIGEQEQLSTTVPQQLNISSTTNEVEMIDNEQQIDIPIQHVADEGIQTSPEKAPIRMDMAVQTTPSLHSSSRRSFQTIEQQTTPIIPRASSCQTTPMVSERLSKEPSLPRQQHEQITPLHSKAIVHLRRNVRFQFTPSTDARLTAKEKLEEEQRQQQQQQLPSKQEIQIITDNEREEDTEDETNKTKKKVTTSKKKKVPPAPAPVDDSSEEPTESPTVRTTRNKSRKDTNEPPPVTSTTTHAKKKRSDRKEKKVEPEIVVITTSPPVSTKRANRKRPNPKTSPPETTSPTEPTPKRSKTLEVKQPARGKFFVFFEKFQFSFIFSVPSPEPVERPPIPKKSKKTSSDHPSNNKRKNPMVPMKKGKRRLHSVEQDEGLNTADEEETSQTVVLPPHPEERIPIELSSEEREKVGNLDR